MTNLAPLDANDVVVNVAGIAPNGLTGAAAATRYVGGTATGAPTSGTWAKGDFVISQAGAVYVCTVAGSPGTWVNAAAGTSSPLLATHSYNPTTYVLTPLGTADADVDAANLALTFTAPASGSALIKVEALLVVEPGQTVHLTLRRNTTTVVAQRVMLRDAADQPIQLRVPFTNKLTGLTAGTVYTYKLGGYTTTAGTGAKVGYGDGGGATLGPVVFEAWAA